MDTSELRDRLRFHAEPDGPFPLRDMASALLGVLELHKPVEFLVAKFCEECSISTDERDDDEGGVWVEWPCPTVRLILERMSGGK